MRREEEDRKEFYKTVWKSNFTRRNNFWAQLQSSIAQARSNWRYAVQRSSWGDTVQRSNTIWGRSFNPVLYKQGPTEGTQLEGPAEGTQFKGLKQFWDAPPIQHFTSKVQLKRNSIKTIWDAASNLAFQLKRHSIKTIWDAASNQALYEQGPTVKTQYKTSLVCRVTGRVKKGKSKVG